jgi:hypothetical protein
MRFEPGFDADGNLTEISIMTNPTRKYVLNESEWTDWKNRFTYASPQPDQIPRYQEIRVCAFELAKLIAEDCPPSREKSLAITHLEQTVMWANASIARNEGTDA